MLSTLEINIRDPFVLVYEGKYYMYGTRSATCWGEADGFDCYVSKDLEAWEGPYEVFHRPEGFKYDKNYWAPEVHLYNNAFYMFATFNTVAEDVKGTQVLRSTSPLGPFIPWSEGTITPPQWNCLDGTLCISSDGVPYMVFSHEWVDIFDGEICAVMMSSDLKRAIGEPFTLFNASAAGDWVRPISHRRYPGKEIYVTDGPFAVRNADNSLTLLWASFGDKGYVEAAADSPSGKIEGPWVHRSQPIYSDNGGHGMVFTGLDKKRYLTLHYPNTNYEEHPVFIETSDI